MTSNELAVRRTFMAYERTLMAWIRTSTSLISFGFTIYKFFEYLIIDRQITPRQGLLGPREFALGMIAVGVAALAFALVDSRQARKMLQEACGNYPSLASKLAIIIFFFGLALLILVLLHE